MADVETFDFCALVEGIQVTQAVRITLISDEPWFVAVDIVGVLVDSGARRRGAWNLTRQLNGDDQRQIALPHGRGYRLVTIISEQALFRLLERSGSLRAGAFGHWLRDHVLTSVRLTSEYQDEKAQWILRSSDLLVTLARVLAHRRRKRRAGQ